MKHLIPRWQKYRGMGISLRRCRGNQPRSSFDRMGENAVVPQLRKKTPTITAEVSMWYEVLFRYFKIALLLSIEV